MQRRSSENRSEHHRHYPQMDTVEDYQVFDVMPQRPIVNYAPPYPDVYASVMPQRPIVNYAPPYPDVYASSYGYREPETHKKVILETNYESATKYDKDGNYRVYGEGNIAEADEVIKIKRNGYKVYEEDVDAEADDFIKFEHKKYQLGKSMSMDGF